MEIVRDNLFVTPSGNIYYELAELPIYGKAEFIPTYGVDSETMGPSPSLIRATTLVSDHLQNTKRSSVKHIFIAPDGRSAFSTPVQDQASAVASYASSSGKLLVVLREQFSEETHAKKRSVELWQGDLLKALQDVTETHEAFYTDDMLGSSGFSKDETSFVYTAELNCKTATNNTSNQPQAPFDKFRFAPRMGEKYSASQRPTLFVFRWDLPIQASLPDLELNNLDYKSNQTLASAVVRIQAVVPNDIHITFGQATLDEAGKSIYATGYEHLSDGRFLGIVGCFNRPSSIWKLSLPQQTSTSDGSLYCAAQRLTDSDMSARSPRYIQFEAHEHIFYLAHKRGGPHHSCAQLRSVDTDGTKDQIVVDFVWKPQFNNVNDPGFPGLYLDQLPAQPFLQLDNGLHIALHSQREFCSTVYLVNVKDRMCTRIIDQQSAEIYHWTLLATDGRRSFVCTRSYTNIPHELVLGTVDPSSGTEQPTAKFVVIDKPSLPSRASEALKRITCSIYSVPQKPWIQSIIIRANTDRSDVINPSIMIPHGGPHVASTIEFNPLQTSLALQNYTLYLPNYTGSLGYGLKYVEDLIGKCGSTDIQDCLEVREGLIGTGIIRNGQGQEFVYGGSHGGFIAAHLIGRYPDIFSGAAIRNPVINVGAMVNTTDIPDWCYEELGFAETTPLISDIPLRVDPEIYAAMFKNSPMCHAQDIITPVLLLLGEQDQRVPPPQGRALFHLLKGQGTPTELLVFPGKGHSLEQVESARMSYEATRWWFKRYRSQT